ncbi:MAG: glutamine-hydrolyzing GMP synthase [Gammaproteobacteria bacterium]
MHTQKILILDFGSQYAQLIARRVREIGVYCEIHSYDMPAEKIRAFGPNGIILSGSPESVIGEEPVKPASIVYQLEVPVLGICYGMQTMALELGGEVSSQGHSEFGSIQVELHNHSHLFQGIEDDSTPDNRALLEVWMSHGDKVTRVPDGFKVIAKSANTPIAAMADESRHFYALQFHPEVTHTRQGKRIFERFLVDVCRCQQNWTPNNIIKALVTYCRDTIGQDKVILGLSGGVDSSVTAALLHKAIGDQLTCVFVDNGLLRYNEAERILTAFGTHIGLKVIHVNAEERFLHALRNMTEPEQKRKVIGAKFIDIFEEEAKQLQNVTWLAQGTIYSDVIESAQTKTANGKAHVIKSHHNVGGLPEKMQLKIFEPLRELFKDEVRAIGLELGLPYDMIYRHPFPGPGLAVRIIGEVKKEYADKLRIADDIFIEELNKAGYYDKVSQAFAVLLPIKSVGVVGDARQYEPVIALRAVETIDFMTAHWARIPYDIIERTANRIVNEVPGISRVVYDVTSKPPATIEWE